MTCCASAQIQQAWVARYNNGSGNSTNQAVKIALDSAGNIYVTGFSQNGNSNLGYVTIKYAPSGNQLWASRYDSTNYPSATPAALALDSSNDVFVTGSALTIKYDPNGNQIWTAPYSGTSLAADADGNSYVTGFSTSFDTIKLGAAGSNLWQTSYVDVGPTISQVVLLDDSNNVYVAGSDTYYCFPGNCYAQLLIVKYDSNGNQLWTSTNNEDDASISTVHVQGAALDSVGNFNLLVDFGLYINFVTLKYNASGSLLWTAFDPGPDTAADVPHGLVLDKLGNVIATGQSVYIAPSYAYATFQYGTYKAAANGAWIWTNTFPTVPIQPSVANAIAVDGANNSYVTGYSPGANSSNDIATIKYDQNGNQIWLQRYNGPGNGNDAGNAIAVDNNGNVYVTGYETTAAGGTEIVTIKYSPLTLQRRADGTVLLEAQGSPGESFEIQASADLLYWLDLGSVVADTNGLMQFDDTNAPNYSARFYVTSPQ
jgi:hypothetical protein